MGLYSASVGSAVGMANVGVSQQDGQQRWQRLLLIYLLFVVIFSYVGCLPSSPWGGTRHRYLRLLRERLGHPWQDHGQGGRSAGLAAPGRPPCIAIGYAVIVTYVLKALVDSVLGTLMTTDTAAWFGSFSAQPYSVIPFHIIVVVGTLLTLFLGAKSIERTNKVMMPLFFVIFLILAVRVAFLAGSGEGYAFMFTPRWEMLADPMIWIWAMGQAFFSLSVTGSGNRSSTVHIFLRKKTWWAWHSTRRCLTPSPPWWPLWS